MVKKICFMGTAKFAVPILKALIDSEKYRPCLLITQPDVQVGRKRTWQMPATKITALEHGIEVLQPQTLKNNETAAYLLEQEIDLIITAAYGKILPQAMLKAPKSGAINIHGSLLPKYRGASPIQSTLLNGDKVGGVSVIEMVEKMDAGAIYASYSRNIGADTDYGELETELSELAAENIITFLDDYFAGKLQACPQQEADVSYCKLLSRDDGLIDWTKSATEIHNLIRAFNPWPNTFTDYQNKRVKIYASKVFNSDNSDLPITLSALIKENYDSLKSDNGNVPLEACGTVLANKQGRLFVACNNSILEITDMQFAGSKRCAIKDIAHNLSIFSQFKNVEA